MNLKATGEIKKVVISKDGVGSAAQLQALLDRGGLVCVPPGKFTISSPLRIGDNTRLALSPATVLRLADNANCPILMNRDKGKVPTRNVIIEGGVWDGNNLHQRRGSCAKAMYYDWGQFICLFSMENLTLRDMVIKDPESFAVQLMAVENFTVENITFDFNMRRENMDGIHINGPAHGGCIRNIRGSTNDDMIALNSDEGFQYSDKCDISDVSIDGLYGGSFGYNAVRLLSRRSHVRNVSIRNVFGKYRYHAVSFTHFSGTGDKLGWFDGITLDGIYASFVRGHTDFGGLIYFQQGVNQTGAITIRNVVRIDEDGVNNPFYTIHLRENTHVRRLYLSNIYQRIADSNRPIFKKESTALIDELYIDNVRHDQSMESNLGGLGH